MTLTLNLTCTVRIPCRLVIICVNSNVGRMCEQTMMNILIGCSGGQIWENKVSRSIADNYQIYIVHRYASL